MSGDPLLEVLCVGVCVWVHVCAPPEYSPPPIVLSLESARNAALRKNNTEKRGASGGNGGGDAASDQIKGEGAGGGVVAQHNAVEILYDLACMQ
jgi:hypothetical protein